MFTHTQTRKEANLIQLNINRENIILSKYKSGLTMQKIGEDFNISRERVRQIVARALAAEIDKSKNINQNLLFAIEKRKHERLRLINRWGLKRYKFRKALMCRLEKINHQFFLLAKYANRNVYGYNEQDVDKIFSEVERKVKETKAKFHFPKKREFKL